MSRSRKLKTRVSGRSNGPQLYGYTDILSVAPGEQIGFHVSTNVSKYDMEIARIGSERQIVWSKNDLPGVEYPIPDHASSHGCRWPQAFNLTVPKSWPSGYYGALLHGHDSEGRTAQGELCFVVRSAQPGRDTSILLQRTTNTDNAYNSWGGTTLYNGPAGPGRRVSFDRPFAGFPGSEKFLCAIGTEFENTLDKGHISDGLAAALAEQGVTLSRYRFVQIECAGRKWHIFDAGMIATLQREADAIRVYDGFSTWESCWHHWEQHFVAWAERSGYQIDYAVNSDLEFRPEILKDYRLVLSVGHDEYWSSSMRDHLEAFIANGGNVAFFSGNCLFWQVRSENDGRDLVCWKEEYNRDPIYQSGNRRHLSTLWCHHLVDRPENHLTGVSFAFGGYHGFFDQYQDGPGCYTIHRPEHWIFEGTRVKRGDRLGCRNKIVNYECDGCEICVENGLPEPTHRDGTPETFRILATAPAGLTAADGSLEMASEAVYGPKSGRRLRQPGAAVLGIYERGGTVVTAGSTDWVFGLKGGDTVVEQITRNILERLSK